VLSRRDWLRHHLQANHFPPLPPGYIDVAECAIEHCRDDEPRALIELPGGVETTAAECVRALHLSPFVDAEPAE
jgi:hypothetical protein